jgi:hypothetical protein
MWLRCFPQKRKLSRRILRFPAPFHSPNGKPGCSLVRAVTILHRDAKEIRHEFIPL